MIKPPSGKPVSAAELAAKIAAKARRKQFAQQSHMPSPWSGLGLMGLVGWSIVVPTLLGTALGLWLDRHYPAQHSWALALLMAGLTLGCFNAWHWIANEDRAMREVQPSAQPSVLPSDKEQKDETTLD
jgi:ATP synthase protein I